MFQSNSMWLPFDHHFDIFRSFWKHISKWPVKKCTQKGANNDSVTLITKSILLFLSVSMPFFQLQKLSFLSLKLWKQCFRNEWKAKSSSLFNTVLILRRMWKMTYIYNGILMTSFKVVLNDAAIGLTFTQTARGRSFALLKKVFER